jgi:uncharacterized protein
VRIQGQLKTPESSCLRVEESSVKKRLILKFALLGAVALAACVTINVYFPAAAAEKAADRIIGDVIGKDGNAPPPDKSPPTGFNIEPTRIERAALLALGRVLNIAVSPARAAEPDLDVSSAAIRQITDSMKARHGQLAKYYDSGAIGYTADGMVSMHDANAIALAERTPVRNSVADENKDRTALYNEIARANGHPEWASSIRSTFAKRWVANAKAGWFYNDGSGWKRK